MSWTERYDGFGPKGWKDFAQSNFPSGHQYRHAYRSYGEDFKELEEDAAAGDANAVQILNTFIAYCVKQRLTE